MRILLDYRPALRERTGVGEYAHELAAAIARHLPPDDRITLFSSSWKDRLPPERIPGLDVVDVRVPVTLLNLAWHRAAWPPVELFAGGADVAHSLHPLLMPARHAAQVVTVHDLYFLENPENTAAEIRRDYPALAADHARRADGILTVSEYTASKIRSRFDVPADRITICAPGAPKWPAVDTYAANGPIVFMGTIEPRKNVQMLLEAYGHLLALRPDAPPLVLAGRVAPACAGVMELVNRPPLAGHVTHVGYVAGRDREGLYRSASMIVMPSLDEGFGIPALEAMTLGIPVVVSNRGALPEVVGDAGLLVAADDPAGMAAAMGRVLGDSALARQLSERGVARARRFTWDASAAAAIDAYRLAMERRRSRS